MNAFRTTSYFLFFLILLTTLFIAGCDEEFDEPPIDTLPTIDANATIAEIKGLYSGGASVQIPDDKIISGVVIADDESGNFYQNIVIQDSTGGVQIRLGTVGLYTLYPVGSRVYVRCQGLYIGQYEGAPQISGDSEGNVIAPEGLIYAAVLPGQRDVPVTPTVRTIDGLSPDDLYTLIELENVEFTCDEVGQTFADAANLQTVNRIVTDCDGNTIIVRNSGYADFAAQPLPQGNGSLVAVYSTFRGDAQLFLRTANDVAGMTDDRCFPCTSSDTTLDIAVVRAAYTGDDGPAPSGKIRGIVTSDRANGNIDVRNLFVEDATGGIVVRFQNEHTFNLGDEIEVDISGQELSEFNGLLQVSFVPNGTATVVGNGTITPRTVTVNELLTNFEDLEGTLIRIESATISGGATYGGTRTVTDATGSMDMYTRSQASFAGAFIPGGEVSITGIVSQFNNPQLILRNTNDVSGGSASNILLFETFDNVTIDAAVALPGWVQYLEEGAVEWIGREFSNDQFAQINPYQSNEPSVISWLITPSFELDGAAVLTFNTTVAFVQQAGLTVWISTDFDGSDVEGATWSQLSANIASSSTNYTEEPSGDVDLSAFSGTAHIAFRYEGDGFSNTTLYQLDDVKVEIP